MKLLYFTLTFFTASTAYAQDTHYWTQQFGSKSTLMSGSLVAGSEDISMLYYNPGAIGLIKRGALTISANLYKIENIKITNALGDRADFRSSQFATVPLMAGGMLNTKHKLKIAYGILSPVDFNFKALARFDGNLPVVDDTESPGNEAVIATASKNSKLTETIAAIGAGYPLTERLSVGGTLLFNFRSQSYFQTLLSRMYLNDANQTFVNTTLLRNASYWNLRGSLKLGAAYRAGNWSYGLTLSTPSFNMMGNGIVAADVAANNLKLNDQRTNILASDRQIKIKSTYKSPFTVSGGVQYKNATSTLALAVQYFGSIKPYEVLQAEPSAFVRPPEIYAELGSENFLKVRAAARPVVNVAVGYELLLKERVPLNIGFRTDMSYYDKSLFDKKGINTVITSWDLYHLVLGSAYTSNRHSISYGILYSFGKSDSYKGDGNIENPSEGSLLQGSTTITKAGYSSIGLMLGYTYSFN